MPGLANTGLLYDGPGLSARQRAFVVEYVRDFDLDRALRTVGERSYEIRNAVLLHPPIAAEIARQHEERIANDCDAKSLIERLKLIAFADPNELIEHRRVACPECWCGVPPHDRDLIDPECPKCYGDGESYVVVKDTRYLSPAGRALYAGLKVTHKDGKIEVLMHKQLEAIDMLCRILGAYEEDNRQRSDGLKQLMDYVAQQGAALPIAEEAEEIPFVEKAP